MKIVQMLGLLILFSSVGLLLAGGVGVPRKEDVPKYMKQLKSGRPADRAKAAMMLGQRGGINATDVEPAIEPLKTLLQKDKDASVRAAAARALGDIHSEAATTVPVLIDALKNDKVMDVKMATVVALGQFGPDAKAALPTLREMASKFTDKKSKKSKQAQTIQTNMQLISGKKKKKG